MVHQLDPLTFRRLEGEVEGYFSYRKKSILTYEVQYKFVNYYFTNNTKYMWFLTFLVSKILAIITAS